MIIYIILVAAAIATNVLRRYEEIEGVEQVEGDYPLWRGVVIAGMVTVVIENIVLSFFVGQQIMYVPKGWHDVEYLKWSAAVSGVVSGYCLGWFFVDCATQWGLFGVWKEKYKWDVSYPVEVVEHTLNAALISFRLWHFMIARYIVEDQILKLKTEGRGGSDRARA